MTTASKHERVPPRKSTSLQNTKRKAVPTPDLVGSSTRARTRQDIAIKENGLRERVDLQDVKYTGDPEVHLEEDLAVDNFELAKKIVLDLPTESADKPATPKGSRKRQKTKVLEAEEISKAQTIEENSNVITQKVKLEVKEEEEDQVNEVSPIKFKRKRKGLGEEETGKEVREPLTDERAPKTTKRKRQTKQERAGEEEEEDRVGEEGSPKKLKRKRKTKEEKEAEAMPLAARTTSLRMYIGAHVSGAKGTSCLLAM